MIDLAAYSTRIGLPLAAGPSADLLADLQRAHRLAIPFENLDIPLGRGISIDPGLVFDKLVLQRRGGYCFEQNQLFLHVLQALGYLARPLLARVWMSAGEAPPVKDAQPATHMLILARIDEQDWICDVGFGGSYAPPLRLVPDEVVTSPDGARHRLMSDASYGCMLQRDGGSGWTNQYSFHLFEVADVDLEVANHWTSTKAGTRFTSRCVASLAMPTGFITMVNREFTRTEQGVSSSRTIADIDEYWASLEAEFGISLGLAEVEAFDLFEGVGRETPPSRPA